MTVVEVEVTRNHAAAIRITIPAVTVIATRPIGARKGRRCKLAGIVMAR